MLIETLTTIKADGKTYPAGSQYFCPDDEAFGLIESGMAKPSNRSSIRQFKKMKAAMPAPIPDGPDIRDQFVSAPTQARPIGGRFGFSGGSFRVKS